MDWLEQAKNLPVGQHTRIDCPNCGVGTNTNAAIINHNLKYYNCYCNACGQVGHENKGVMTLEERARINELNAVSERLMAVQGELKLPDDTSWNHDDFPREARMWLYKGGLTPTLWSKYRIGYSGHLKRVVLPVYDEQGSLIWFQCRAIFEGQKPKYLQPSRDKSRVLFTAGNQEASKLAVIVEDILSAIRVGEATDGRFGGVSRFVGVSLLGTKIQSGQAALLGRYDQVTTWLDGDKAGQRGSAEIRKTLGLVCDVSNIRTEQDPKCYSNQEILNIINGA